MKIEVFGSGCPKCLELEKNVKEAVKKLNLTAEVTHVYDVDKVIEAGVMMTPAIAIDGTVVSSGKVLNVVELIKLLKR